MKVYFENIQDVITSELSKAKQSIRIAVPWINNSNIFDILKEKCSIIQTQILFENDDNNLTGGLDFQSYIDKGGSLFFNEGEMLMHNKFCIIDDKTLISGSYNWTYGAEFKNYENIIVIKNSEIIESFSKEFNKLVDKATVCENYVDSSKSKYSKIENIFEKPQFKITIGNDELSNPDTMAKKLISIYNDHCDDTNKIMLANSIISVLNSENYFKMFIQNSHNLRLAILIIYMANGNYESAKKINRTLVKSVDLDLVKKLTMNKIKLDLSKNWLPIL